MLHIVSDGMKESDFLFLFVVILLLCLFLILARGIHIGFDFPELLRIRTDNGSYKSSNHLINCERYSMVIDTPRSKGSIINVSRE